MQVARDANGHRPRPRQCHPLPFAAFSALFSLPQFFFAAPSDQPSIRQTLLPCALARTARIVARTNTSGKTESMRWGNTVLPQLHAFPKRSDGWKNVRNSSLSIV
jgi:hypothetical protein